MLIIELINGLMLKLGLSRLKRKEYKKKRFFAMISVISFDCDVIINFVCVVAIGFKRSLIKRL